MKEEETNRWVSELKSIDSIQAIGHIVTWSSYTNKLHRNLSSDDSVITSYISHIYLKLVWQEEETQANEQRHKIWIRATDPHIYYHPYYQAFENVSLV